MRLDMQAISSWLEPILGWLGEVTPGHWVTAGAAVLVAVVVYRASKRYERAKFHSTMQQLWNTTDTQADRSPEDRKVADRVLSGERQLGDIDPARAKYFAFMV